MRISNSTSCGLWPAHIGRTIRCDEQGFVLGAETPLIRRARAGGFAVEADAERCLALLSVVGRRAVGAELLVPLQAAAKHWQSGDKALANLRLIFSGLPALDEAADAYRLRAAAYCLDHGLAPRELMKALDLDPAVLDPAPAFPEPRVPPGHGRESGEWTDGANDARSNELFDLKSGPHRIQIAANGPFKPGGIETVPSQSIDPLDPAGLNKEPPSPEEQQLIANTLTTALAGTLDEIKKLQCHNYQNLPHLVTGAMLPPDPSGYRSCSVGPVDGRDRGLKRLIINGASNIAYYTSNHYYSFYAVDINR